jgi:hypothetical protein
VDDKSGFDDATDGYRAMADPQGVEGAHPTLNPNLNREKENE